MFWTMPEEDLEIEVKSVWHETVKRILECKANDLPKGSENPVAHVRPHARDSNDTYPTHYGINIPKKSFWLNKEYILTQIQNKLSN